MRSDGVAFRAVAWAIGLSMPCASCSRDLSDAAQEGPDAVRAALEASSDRDRPNKDGDAMVHVAVLRHDPHMLGVVIASGVRIDQRNAEDMTALGIAAAARGVRMDRRGERDVMAPRRPEPDEASLICASELLKAHADPDAAQGPHGDRPLHLAAAAGSPELVDMLLRAGADPNGRNGRGETPLHAAASADEYRAVPVTSLLLARGADSRATDVLGETPVHKAAEHDSTELLAYYSRLGADLSAPNAWGETPLDRAIEAHRDHATDMLYRLGAHVSWTQRFEPPLLTAARTDDVERAWSLLAFGADPREPFEGKSAVEVARESGSAAVLAILAGTPARP